MDSKYPTETPEHTRTTQRHIPEYGILHSHQCQNFKYYILFHIFIYSEYRVLFSSSSSSSVQQASSEYAAWLVLLLYVHLSFSVFSETR
jgi:hypothetical protein